MKKDGTKKLFEYLLLKKKNDIIGLKDIKNFFLTKVKLDFLTDHGIIELE
jgi:hypothetical protein